MDPYAVLGVARDAPLDEIRRAYVALARSTHPDVRGDDPVAAERMRRINLAWETLSDADARAALDRQLRYQPGSGPASTGSPASRQRFSSGASRFESGWDDDLDVDRDGSHDHVDGDDRAITAGELPAWMRLGAPAAFVLGIFAVIFGAMVGAFILVRLGLLTLGLSVVIFVLSPFVVLVRSRGGPMR